MEDGWACLECLSVNHRAASQCTGCGSRRAFLRPATQAIADPAAGGSFCPHCGARALGAFCANCGNRLEPGIEAGAKAPTGRLLPVAAIIALVVLVVAVGVLALERLSPAYVALPGATTSGATGYAGSVFRGDGFSVRVPEAYGLQYARLGGADGWMGAHDNGEPIAFTVLPIRNLLPIEQSLEGALGRARSGGSNVGVTIRNETAVTLPAGAAYRYDGEFEGMPTVGYVFYRGSTALMLTTINMPARLAEQVASTIEFG
jgi:hypothetical protein